MSYLNSKPLIHGVEARGVAVDVAVPSRLLPLALGDAHDLTLLPLADLVRHADELVGVPCGGIACAGPTWTVRVYSRVPLHAVARLHADTDSHTSVTLARLVFAERFGRQPELVDIDAAAVDWGDPVAEAPDAVLLIGDKVVTDPPPRSLYPIELDLGDAWHRMTGLPFTFAIWTRRRDRPLDPAGLPTLLERQLDANLRQLPELVEAYAPTHRWPSHLAADYLGRVLHYRIGEAERRGIERYVELAVKHDILKEPRSGPLVQSPGDA